jgi:hypothetical protein
LEVELEDWNLDRIQRYRKRRLLLTAELNIGALSTSADTVRVVPRDARHVTHAGPIRFALVST